MFVDLLCGGPCRDSDDNGPKGGNNEFSKCGSCKKKNTMYPIKLRAQCGEAVDVHELTCLKLLGIFHKDSSAQSQ
jgi:hypothetical protein